MSGCAIAALIVGVLCALGVIGVGVAVVLFERSSVGKDLTTTVVSAAKAQSAPGTKEMRAAGCADATSMDMSAIGHFTKRFVVDAGPAQRAEVEQMQGLYAVSCDSPTLTCEEVAAAWGRGAPKNARAAMVNVSPKAGAPATCNGTFTRDGKRVADVVVPENPK